MRIQSLISILNQNHCFVFLHMCIKRAALSPTVLSIIKESSVAFPQQAALQVHRPEIHGEVQEPA